MKNRPKISRLIAILIAAVVLLSSVSAYAWDRGYYRSYRDSRNFWASANFGAFSFYYGPRVVVREVVAYPHYHYYDTGRVYYVAPQPSYSSCGDYSTVYVIP